MLYLIGSLQHYLFQFARLGFSRAAVLSPPPPPLARCLWRRKENYSNWMKPALWRRKAFCSLVLLERSRKEEFKLPPTVSDTFTFQALIIRKSRQPFLKNSHINLESWHWTAHKSSTPDILARQFLRLCCGATTICRGCFLLLREKVLQLRREWRVLWQELPVVHWKTGISRDIIWWVVVWMFDHGSGRYTFDQITGELQQMWENYGKCMNKYEVCG